MHALGCPTKVPIYHDWFGEEVNIDLRGLKITLFSTKTYQWQTFGPQGEPIL